jgi:hypothetical protein
LTTRAWRSGAFIAASFLAGRFSPAHARGHEKRQKESAMSQRDSGFARLERDNYATPAWVTAALLPHLPAPPLRIWEGAAGDGSMVRAFIIGGYTVTGTDIAEGQDFLCCPAVECDAIVTNPPYALAQEFIEHAMALTRPACLVAMLLRCDFDHAASRK